ncbi:MAG: hypothetical protein OIF56_01340 [Cohaesibacter sp.]|nr:hypothetical protein [Cohaesibacter sp.]MCV6600972.1 hypothetical protein [Cohaesibacter sp.]
MPTLPGLFQIGSYQMVVLQVLLLAGIIGAITAKAKGRSGILWFILSIVTFGVAIVVVLFLPAIIKIKDEGDKATTSGASDSKS